MTPWEIWLRPFKAAKRIAVLEQKNETLTKVCIEAGDTGLRLYAENEQLRRSPVAEGTEAQFAVICKLENENKKLKENISRMTERFNAAYEAWGASVGLPPSA